MDLALRKTYRKQLTELIKEADKISKEETIDENEIPVLIARIKALQVSLNTINEKLIPTYNENELERESEKIVFYEDNAVQAISRLQQRLKSQMQRTTAPFLEGQDRGAQQQQVRYNSVKLPKLNIIKFDGEIASWPAFWEQFSPAIHNNPDLNDATKFAYLKSYLTGKAAISIAGLTSSQSCYNDAVELLKSEYANTERIVDVYINKLMAIPHVRYEKDVQGLRKLFNTATTITKSLKSLGISPEQYGLLVKSIIFKALPYNLRIAFNKQKINDLTVNDNTNTSNTNYEQSNVSESSIDYNRQIVDLLQFMKVELDSMEQARDTTESEYKQKFNRQYTDKGKPKQFTAAGLLASVKDCCLFCQSKAHETKDCDSSINYNDKKEILKKRHLCFRCIKPNHNARFCKTKDLTCTKCKQRHVTTMCDPKYRERQNATTANNLNVTVTDKNSTTATLLTKSQIDNVYLKTAYAYVTSKSSDKSLIRLVIDGGSQTTFIKENLSRELGLSIVGTHKIAIHAFGQNTNAPARICNRVKVILNSQYTDELIEIYAVEVPEICFDSLKTPSLKNPVIENFARQHDLADMNMKQEQCVINGIALLIGSDNYWKVVKRDTLPLPLAEDLMAINTKFGWALHGPSTENYNNNYEFMVNLNIVTVLNVQTVVEDVDLKKFWSLESIGISVNEKLKDGFTQDFINDKIVMKNGRYEVLLPWKTNERLDSNYSGALVRANILTNKLLRNGKLYNYDCAVREYIKNDCAEIVPNNDRVDEKTYYMPHRPVYRDDKDTTKLRVVYDASAHAPSFESLNDQLFAGTNLVPDLLKILLNFRIGFIGLIADIEKAFLQITLNEQDRNSHRFLWYSKPINKDISAASELPELATYRMKRVTFGVTTSPFLLAATLKKHFSQQPEHLRKIASLLEKSFYVDDLILAVSTQEEAFIVYKESKKILSEASMNLRKWHSNDPEVNARLQEEGEVMTRIDGQKVLGVVWFTSTDELSIDLASILNDKNDENPTKRNVLQTIAKIYDPIGMIGPYTVKAKIILQCVWKEKLEWDATLPEKLKNDWLQWRSQLATLTNYQIPRVVLSNRTNEVELHIFADASLQAYGAIAYVKCLETKRCNFLIARNRVAPLNKTGKNQLTLPKLELTAALCAVRLQNYILENISLNVKSIIMWSDSKITLYWIKGETNKKEIYIRNRVTEIRNLNKGKWRHCPSKDNPADLVTRGVSASFLCESQLWTEGPPWLKEESQTWPVSDIEKYVAEEAIVLNTSKQEEQLIEPIFDLQKYEKLERVLRITAYVLKFINNCKTKTTEPLKVDELKSAEIYWIKITQKQNFPDEITALSASKEISNRSSILTLCPFLDKDGIMRLGGRLQESILPYEVKHPIILPKKSLYVNKLIIKCHEVVMHSGVNATLNETRKRYWILSGRQQIKSICGRCLSCKRMKNKAGNEPFAPLPKNRMTMANPFKFTGVDFAGPLYVTIGNKQIKTYIMLLTCGVVRAIHLELVPDMSTESCIKALRRFIARRGVPSVIYSDNAKTFRRTSLEIRELFQILESEAIQDLGRQHRIEWRFIVERAAWWGGFWERLVKSVKDALKLTLGRAHVNYEELSTILTEVEATINSRPLTYISDDPSNLLILTPSHFLIGSNENGFSMNLKNSIIRRNDVLKMWKEREELTTKYWKRWCTDYLQQLRSVHHTKYIKPRPLQRGDVVLLYDQHLPRLQWKLVRVLDLFQGRDGKVRACEVQTSSGTKLRRPIQLLFPLEVEDSSPGEDVENTSRDGAGSAVSDRCGEVVVDRQSY